MTFVKQPDGSYIEASGVSGKVVDDTKDFGVPVSGVPPAKCEDYTTESECVAAGCYWHDGACYKSPPEVVCSGYTTESTCTAAGCYWHDGACHSRLVPPEDELPIVPIIIAVAGSIIIAIGIFFAVKR